MKMVLACILLLITATPSRPSGITEGRVANNDIATRQEILRLLQERRDAFYVGDIRKFSEFESDDFTRITEDGELVTKKQQLAWMAASHGSYETQIYADHDLKVGIYGDIAVITGRLTETVRSESGNMQNDESRFTEIWIFREGRWQTLHNHYTTIRNEKTG